MRPDQFSQLIGLCLMLVGVIACHKEASTPLRAETSLRVNPAFAAEQLPDKARLWYTRLWAQIENPDQFPDADELAASKDTYHYGRALNTHITSLLQVFRVTGDPRLLEEVDRLGQLMRAQLRDWSIPVYRGSDYVADGYLNWQYFRHEGYYGSDAHQMDEMLAHTVVAAMAYAFHVNRDSAPLYAERADFWTDYLLNHFEAKWRDRKGIATGFPFLTKELAHVYLQWTRYHYYMHKLTGNPGYRAEAIRMAGVIERHLQIVETPRAEVFVWTHGMPELGEPSYGAQRMNYARYTMQAAADLALEGFGPFGRQGFMERLSNTCAVLMMDRQAPESFPLRIDGSGEEREALSRYLYSPFCQLAYWDESDRITTVSVRAYQIFETEPETPRCLHIPAGMVFSLLGKALRTSPATAD